MKKFILGIVVGMFFETFSFCSDNQLLLAEFSPAPNQTHQIQKIENKAIKTLSCRIEDPKTPLPSSQSDGNIIGTAVQQMVNIMNHFGYTLRRSQNSENLRQLFDDLTREAQANND